MGMLYLCRNMAGQILAPWTKYLNKIPMEEIWKDMPEYEGIYQVSNLGRLRSLGNGKSFNSKERILKPATNHRGYIIYYLWKANKRKTQEIHRFITKAFIPKPKLHVNHINGIKTDNRIENLEWITHKQNLYHYINTQPKKFLEKRKGEGHWKSKLVDKQVRIIKHCINLKMSDKEIAKYFPTSKSNIGSIRAGITWKHIIT